MFHENKDSTWLSRPFYGPAGNEDVPQEKECVKEGQDTARYLMN